MTHRVFWLTCIGSGLGILFLFFPIANPPSQAMENPAMIKAQARATGLVIHVEPTKGPAPSGPPRAEARPLSPDALKQLLARLPATESMPDQRATFKPIELLPPPKPLAPREKVFGTRTESSPSPITVSEPLHVRRYSPDGDVDIAPRLSITFSKPMVPLASQESDPLHDVPVHLEPQVPGTWQWLGTQTLVFQPTTRFPQATEFRVHIPTDWRAVDRSHLKEAVRWSFRTPPPKLIHTYPQGSSQPLDPTIFLGFDQAISIEQALPFIEVAANGELVEIAVCSSRDLIMQGGLSRSFADLNPDRWIALKPTRPLPTASRIEVTVHKGMPSAEGPRVTETPQRFDFNTYAPLTVLESRCGWRSCQPRSPWRIRFSNPLDEESFDLSMLKVDPPLPHLTASVRGRWLDIQPASAGRTSYRLSLSQALADVFDQTLAKPETLTFEVEAAEPGFQAHGPAFFVADPVGNPTLKIATINYKSLKLTVSQVDTDDWAAYSRTAFQYSSAPGPIPGKIITDVTLPVSHQPDDWVQTTVDLEAYGLKPESQCVVRITPGEVDPEAPKPDHRHQRNPQRLVWIQRTQLGMAAFDDGENLRVWVNALADGSPAANAEVRLFSVDQPSKPLAQVRTNASGLAVIPLNSMAMKANSDRGPRFLRAELRDQSAFLPESLYLHQGISNWAFRPSSSSLISMVMDDRQLYRPGETVHIKGYLRRFSPSLNELQIPDPSKHGLAVSITESQGNEIFRSKLSLSPFGAFDFSFPIPEKTNLGQATAHFTMDGAMDESFSHAFRIEEFRRPEFEVTVTLSEGPLVVLDSAWVKARASYYAGGGLPNAPVRWQIRSRPTSYHPPGWDDFIFGQWIPWWRRDDGTPVQTAITQQGITDRQGEHGLKLDFASVDPPTPHVVEAEVEVQDVNRQAWQAQAQSVVHPSTWYVGLRSDQYFVSKGEPFKLKAVVTDIQGRPVPDALVEIRAAHMSWKSIKGSWQQVEGHVQRINLRSQTDPVPFEIETQAGGTMEIEARVVDPRDRPNRTVLTRWISGGIRPENRRLEKEEVVLIPDKERYQPGDTARILVQGPFSPAHGTWSLQRDGILSMTAIDQMPESQTLEIPILEEHIPNVVLDVQMVGQAPRENLSTTQATNLPPRPAYASGQLNLRVSTHHRHLALDMKVQKPALGPGEETTIDFSVTDFEGNPAEEAEIAIAIVDEAVLALTGYQWPDPADIFFPQRPAGVNATYLRSHLYLNQSDDLLQAASGEIDGEFSLAEAEPTMRAKAAMPMAEMQIKQKVEGPAQAIRMRSDFNPLIRFEPSLITDSQGKASLAIKMRDSLTRYRIMAVAVQGSDRFGRADCALTTRLPLMLRPSPPRFLNFGDKAELSVVLQNQTSHTQTAHLALRANLLTQGFPVGFQVEIPAMDRAELRVPVEADHVGMARFDAVVESDDFADAVSFSFPVNTPCTSEAFATYGTLDHDVALQTMASPADVQPDFGGLDITVSTTQLQELTDAYLYLKSYPFSCAEQVASRMLATLAMGEVLQAFEVSGLPTEEEVARFMAADIKHLQDMQNHDGGFDFWVRGRPSWPYVSIHATHALIQAKQKGFPVDEQTIQRAMNYLMEMPRHVKPYDSAHVQSTLRAYACYVLHQADVNIMPTLYTLLDEVPVEQLTLDAAGWLLACLNPLETSPTAETLMHRVNQSIDETASTAQITTSITDGAHLILHSRRKTDAIILDALLQHQPDHDVIPKLTRGLLAHRVQGRWNNTQENAFVLLALNRYFHEAEAVVPDLTFKAWLGPYGVMKHRFEGRNTRPVHTQVPMSFLQEQVTGQTAITLSHEGEGRVYYRLGLAYAPTSLELDPLERGFFVERNYQALDRPEDVVRDLDGTWHVRAGARIRVIVTLAATARRYHVALIDPIPAGLEPLNPGLQGSSGKGKNPVLHSLNGTWVWPWFDHQNLRDDRAEAFRAMLYPGVYSYVYEARATTPGHFVVPPPRAEEMYAPETFGRGATARVIVEEKEPDSP